MDTTDIKTTAFPLRILVVLSNPQTNPFINIITEEITSKDYLIDTDIESFWERTKRYDIIHIHWPDFLNPNNGLAPPTKEFGKKLTKFLHDWKAEGTRIVYTKHDEMTHYGGKASRTYLFDVVEKYADAIVHLGNYSMREMLKNNINIKQLHRLIPHHIYDTLYTNHISQEEARNFLNIPIAKKVILTFGSFRNKEEHLLVKKAFEALDIPEKYLLAPGWHHDGWSKYYNNGFRVKGDTFLGKGTVDKYMLPYCFAAADVVFIQRLRNLNSGNLPLAFLFNKTVVAPNIGNIVEYIDNYNNFLFEPSDISSVVSALKKGIERSQKPQMNEAYAKKHWNTAKIVGLYKQLYIDLAEKAIPRITMNANSSKKICWHNGQAKKKIISIAEAKEKENTNRNYLKEHYSIFISDFKNILDTSDTPDTPDANYPVWLYWEQGEDNMPEIVQICYLSLLQNRNNHPVYLLNKENYKEFVQLPNHILEKRENGIISIAHFSDILRTSLLSHYGGLWLDATILVTSPLPAFEQELFSLKNHTDYEYISQFRWTGFLLYCKKGNILFRFVEKLLNSYWEKENTLIDYLLLDYVIDMAYEHIPEVKRMIDQIPFSNEGIWCLSRLCHCPTAFNLALYQQLTQKTQFHKFTAKDHYFTEANSTYKYLKNKFTR